MRRNVALLVLIVAILVAIAMLRSGRRHPDHTAPRDSTVQPFSEPQTSALPYGDSNAPEQGVSKGSEATSENFQPASELTRPKPDDRIYGSTRRTEVTVLNPDGHPVDDAVVIVFRSRDAWKTYDTSEKWTDKDGKIDISMKLGVEKVRLWSYKTGQGMQGSGLSSIERSVSMTYLPPKPMNIWCQGPNGDLRGGADIVVTSELNLSSRFPESNWMKFPPRNLKTDELGKAVIEGLPVLGPSSDGKTSMPGCRFTITATWQGRTAELKFDDFPLKEVQVIIK